MVRRAISDGEEMQGRDCYAQIITLSEEPKVCSPGCPKQLCDLFSLQARADGGGGEENSH